MTTYFVSRHAAALLWASQNGVDVANAIQVLNLDINLVQAGDAVIGTLPVQLVAQVCGKGARYQHLVLDTPEEWRGQELSIDQMMQCQARLEEYRVVLSGQQQSRLMSDLPKGNGCVQFCIASEQLEANYMAAAQLRPRKVYILASSTPHILMAAQRLEKTLRDLGIDTEIIDNLPVSDPAALREYAFELTRMVRELESATHLMFNATGGKKIMSFALSQAFMATANASVIYVDSESETLQVLSPWGVPNLALVPGLINIESALALRGYRIVSTETAGKDWQDYAVARAGLTNWLAQKAKQLQQFFGWMNLAAYSVKNGLRSVPLKPNGDKSAELRPLSGHVAEAIRRIVEAGLVTWNELDQTISFSDESARSYLNGLWLEEYVWLSLRNIPGADCAGGIQIESVNGKVKNEIDFALAWHNRLFLIECKTKNMSKADANNTDLYRIDSLQKQLGGSFATSMLLSARSLDAPVEQRARQNRALSLQGMQMVQLANVLKKWQSGETIGDIQNWIDALE
jgi:CRISPR-associated protein Csx16